MIVWQDGSYREVLDLYSSLCFLPSSEADYFQPAPLPQYSWETLVLRLSGHAAHLHCLWRYLKVQKSLFRTFPSTFGFWISETIWNVETIFFDDLKPLPRSGLFLTGCEARDHLRSCWWFFGHPWHVPRPSATSGCFGCWWATGYDWLRLSKHARIWTGDLEVTEKLRWSSCFKVL